jgi:SAM-dependent methyltransferase
MRLLRLLADRRVTSFVRRTVFDKALPPFVRDSRALNAIVNKIWLGDVPLDFQREGWTFTEEDWARSWRGIAQAPTMTAREGDTSSAEAAWVIARIRDLAPKRVLEIGAGRGGVAVRIATALPAGGTLTLAEPYASVAPIEGVDVVRAPAHALPFKDKEFDVVVCLHTLEHLTNLFSTFAEIRRVSRRSLIIVPLQRWAPFTWDMHLHFFPYLEYLPGLLELPAFDKRVIDGDGCYEFVHE